MENNNDNQRNSESELEKSIDPSNTGITTEEWTHPAFIRDEELEERYYEKFKPKSNRPKKKIIYNSQRYRKDLMIVNQHDRADINEENPLSQLTEKRTALIRYGYRRLTGKQGMSWNVSDINIESSAKDTRVGKAYRNVYETAKRRISRLTPEQIRDLEAGKAVYLN